MGGCCLVALLATLGPRIVILGLWLFTDYLSRAFGGWLLPLIGFFLLPWTTLAYTLAWWLGYTRLGLSPIAIVMVVLGLLLDIASHGGGYYGRRRTVVYE